MLNNQVNFDFSIMKKLFVVAHEKLINIIGRHGNLDQYSWMSVIPLYDHLCSKSAQKLQLLLGTVQLYIKLGVHVKYGIGRSNGSLAPRFRRPWTRCFTLLKLDTRISPWRCDKKIITPLPLFVSKQIYVRQIELCQNSGHGN